MSCGENIYPIVHTGPLISVAAAALINAEGRILLAQRPADKAMAGLWEFPGGKLNTGETPEGALIRELKEELGIDVFTGCLQALTFVSHAYTDFHMLLMLYLCRQWRGQIVPVEHANLIWVRTEDLGNYQMPAADVPVVRVLQDYL